METFSNGYENKLFKYYNYKFIILNFLSLNGFFNFHNQKNIIFIFKILQDNI